MKILSSLSLFKLWFLFLVIGVSFIVIQIGCLTAFECLLPSQGFAISTLKLHLKMRKSVEPIKRLETEPIDIVYTWVNGSDPAHEASVRALEKSKGYNSGMLKPNRFEDWNTLKYSLRSVEEYANWTRHIFIVTNGQIPCWLNLSNPSVSIVTHEEIFKNKSHLPTFSSPAIDSNIHRIKGLSKRFIYFNDDLFLTAPVSMKDFYEDVCGYKIRLDTYPNALRDCSKTCKQTDVNNGVCDESCFKERCEWDVDDCNGKTKWGNNFKSKQLELSNQPGSNVKTKRMTDTDFKYTRITEDIKSLLSIHVYQEDFTRNIKFNMLADSVEKQLTTEKKTELQKKIDEIFTELFPNPSEFEIRVAYMYRRL